MTKAPHRKASSLALCSQQLTSSFRFVGPCQHWVHGDPPGQTLTGLNWYACQTCIRDLTPLFFCMGRAAPARHTRSRCAQAPPGGLCGSTSFLMQCNATAPASPHVQGPARNQLTVDDGIIQRSLICLLRNLLGIPKHRYQLTATFCGLSAAMDATLVDLLAEGVPVASLKDSSAALAFGKLASHVLEQPDDVYKVEGNGRRQFFYCIFAGIFGISP